MLNYAQGPLLSMCCEAVTAFSEMAALLSLLSCIAIAEKACGQTSVTIY